MSNQSKWREWHGTVGSFMSLRLIVTDCIGYQFEVQYQRLQYEMLQYQLPSNSRGLATMASGFAFIVTRCKAAGAEICGLILAQGSRHESCPSIRNSTRETRRDLLRDGCLPSTLAVFISNTIFRQPFSREIIVGDDHCAQGQRDIDSLKSCRSTSLSDVLGKWWRPRIRR